MSQQNTFDAPFRVIATSDGEAMRRLLFGDRPDPREAAKARLRSAWRNRRVVQATMRMLAHLPRSPFGKADMERADSFVRKHIATLRSL